MLENFIETDHAQYWIEEGIIHVIYKSNLLISLDIAKKMVAERLKLTAGKTMPLYADIRGLISIDTISRKYLAGEEAIKNLSAGAIHINGLISKLAGNIFITVEKPPIPTKLFTDRDKAIGWLEKFKTKSEIKTNKSPHS